MTAPKHIDHILVHWGEDVIWQERKPVMRSRDDSLAVLMRLGKTLGRGVSPQKGLTPQAVRDHLVGLVRASPQVMVKIMGGGSDMKHIGAHFDYIARVGHFKDDRLLMITGPLAMVRKGTFGMRIENGALTGEDPPTAARVHSWVDQNIHIDCRPEWVFVKVHTHGSIEKTAASPCPHMDHILP